MKDKWHQIVSGFPTTPFLFVGSGITRRYLELPDWENLLKTFTNRLSDDAFKYQSYQQAAANQKESIGELIEIDFNKKWFEDESFRTNDPITLQSVQSGVSPFKAEIACFIRQHTARNPLYEQEIATLSELSNRSISGFITTNYDTFLESITTNYKVYIGQENLIFTPIQELAEIFKIHGCVSDPDSIIITAKDYQRFDEKSSYLAAKLMTIFMEYPIIFIGYSISDRNIRKILEAIINCLSDDNISKLANRFIFIQRDSKLNDTLKISDHTMDFSGKLIPMTKIETNNFQIIYDALKGKQAGLPVRILRFLKEQFYNYTLTNNPCKHFVVSSYDPNIPDDNIVFSVGQNSRNVLNGLIGITADNWYRDIVFDNVLLYSADDILEHAFPTLFKQNNKLPIFKYLAAAQQPHDSVSEKISINCFDDLISNSIRRIRMAKRFQRRSVNGIIEEFTESGALDPRALEYLAYLRENEISLNDLEAFLQDYLNLYPNIFSDTNVRSSHKTNLRRLIRIYDWLKYR